MVKRSLSRVKRKNRSSLEDFFLGTIIGVVCIFLGVLAFSALEKYYQAHYLVQHPLLETKNETQPTLVNKPTPEEKKQVIPASPSATFRVPILLYHYVEVIQDTRDTKRAQLNILPSVFEEQVKTLKDAGYTFITAKDLGDVLDGKTKIPEKPVILTFDDGHWDFVTDILPILKKYQAKATQYVIPGFTGGSDYMTQSQVAEASKSGLVDIGAHTVHHLALKGQFYETVKKEVDDSKKMLEDTYHIHVVSFAYPYGSFDDQSIQLVKEAGFTTAVSTLPGIEHNQTNRFFMYRLRPGYRTGQVLLNYLEQTSFKAY